MMQIKFIRAGLEDADCLIDLRNRAFYSDFLQFGFCPAYGISNESMRQRITERVVYLILCDEQPVGCISVRDCGEGHYHLGTLCVVPEFEHRGIGQQALKYVEAAFPDAVLWDLVTPVSKTRNHRFYMQSGFEITGETEDNNIKLFIFQKHIKQK